MDLYCKNFGRKLRRCLSNFSLGRVGKDFWGLLSHNPIEESARKYAESQKIQAENELLRAGLENAPIGNTAKIYCVRIEKITRSLPSSGPMPFNKNRFF